MIDISFGMLKAGSTLTFEITKEILEQNRMPQSKLPPEVIPATRRINFIEHFTPEITASLKTAVAARGYPVVIKTHQQPSDDAVALMRSGEAIAQAVYRDPRDLALSLIDAGNHHRKRGRPEFTEFVTVDDTIDTITRQIDWLKRWLDLPNVLPIYYEDIAFTDEPIHRIAEQLGVTADPVRVRKAAAGKFTQLNKGVSQRHLTDMSPQDQEKLATLFRDFIETFCSEKRPRQPSAAGADAATA